MPPDQNPAETAPGRTPFTRNPGKSMGSHECGGFHREESPLHTYSYHSHGPRSLAAIPAECLEVAWTATGYYFGSGSTICGRIHTGTLPDARHCSLDHYSIPSTIRRTDRMGKSGTGAVSMGICQ